MRVRQSILLVALAVVLAACGGPGGDPTTTTGDATTTEAVVAPEAVELSYALEAGASYSYEVDLDQTIEMTATGDAAAMGEDELPGEMSIQMMGTSTFTHTVADGPEPGTYAVTITGDFSSLDMSGTIDGEPVSSAEIPDFAEMEPVETTVIVDEQGNVIPEDADELGSDMFGVFGGLGMMQQFGSGGIGQFVGPPLTDEEVTVGDTWSETVEVPMLPGDDPITTVVDSEVVSADALDGHDVLVIQTTSTTSPIEFDLAEVLIGFFTTFTPEGASEEELAELDALAAELRFVFSIDETVGDTTTWFDPTEGLARVSESSSDAHMVFDINMPDEETGDPIAFAMDMTVGSEVVYRLVDSTST